MQSNHHTRKIKVDELSGLSKAVLLSKCVCQAVASQVIQGGTETELGWWWAETTKGVSASCNRAFRDQEYPSRP